LGYNSSHMENKNTKNGHLIMASADIGNGADLPSRSLDALRDSNLLIFEEDRPARRFLKAAGITRNYLKLNEHKNNLVLEDARTALKKGQQICYMSDQGTACLADPGVDLLKLAESLGTKVTVIPGPSSVSAAISACPFDCSKFYYVGFPPRKEAERKRFLANAGTTPAALVIMDTPYRIKQLLTDCASVFPNRKAVVALDISGAQEAYWYGKFSTLLKRAEKLKEKLNFVLVIESEK
jgi:16S rRNA (cytidine1402-2'-O)-methyltransferase